MNCQTPIGQGRRTYASLRDELRRRAGSDTLAGGVDIDAVLQLKIQNTYDTHLDVARAMALQMRKDMATYDADPGQYTQSLGCWSGFHAQQMIKAVRRMRGHNRRVYVYLSGWMVAGMRSRFGHLPDQSMHEKTAVVDLIDEIYTSLRQADEVALNDLFEQLRAARGNGVDGIVDQIDSFQSHVVPMIADIDAGFGNQHATYLLARQMIRAGACCIQIENQVSDAKQCGHQDGKVTTPRDDFIEKLRAVRLAFEELGVDDGVIVARTDSLSGGLTEKIPPVTQSGDMASEYIKWLDTEEITDSTPLGEGEVAIRLEGKLVRPVRLANGLFQFRSGTGEDRAVEDCIASLTGGGADLIWIETDRPDVDQIARMVERVRRVVPTAKLVYNNSPSFNWTLKLRQQIRAEWIVSGRVSENDYPEGAELMQEHYDGSDLGIEADSRIGSFQKDISARAGVFHNLITLPTFHLDAEGMDRLSRGYFGDDGMLAYVASIQRQEIRSQVGAVKHQHEVGSGLGDSFKRMVAGNRALTAGGAANTMNQF